MQDSFTLQLLSCVLYLDTFYYKNKVIILCTRFTPLDSLKKERTIYKKQLSNGVN